MNFALKLIITFCAGTAVDIMVYAMAPELLRTKDTAPLQDNPQNINSLV